MERMTENQYIITLLEQALEKLDQIEKRLDNQDAKLSQHKTVYHPFRSKGIRYTDPALRDTQVSNRRY